MTTSPFNAMFSQGVRSTLHGETMAAIIIGVAIAFITSTLFAFYMGKKKAGEQARFRRLAAVGASSSTNGGSSV